MNSPERRPAPYSADTRAKGWRFELDMERARQSDTWALATPEARPWLLMLWATAWEQTPCGSLPNDDSLIAARLGMPDKVFAKHKAILLRKWWAADDGRLYHDVLVLRVNEMVDRRTADADRKRGFDSKVARIKQRDGGACVYCGATTYLQADHLIPRVNGGTHEDTNLVCACRKCNATKGGRNPDEAGMSFVSESARLMWEELKNGVDSRVRNALPTHDARVNDVTGTGTGTSREDYGAKAPASSAQTTPAAAVCIALKAKGISAVSPGHPRLLTLLDSGATVEEFESMAGKALEAAPGRAFEYVLGAVEGERTRAKATAGKLHRGPLQVVSKQQAIEDNNRRIATEWAAS